MGPCNWGVKCEQVCIKWVCVYIKNDGLSLVEVAVGVLVVSLHQHMCSWGVPAAFDVGVRTTCTTCSVVRLYRLFVIQLTVVTLV